MGLHLDGLTIDDIAELTGRDPGDVLELLAEAQRRGEWTAYQATRFAELTRHGRTIAQAQETSDLASMPTHHIGARLYGMTTDALAAPLLPDMPALDRVRAWVDTEWKPRHPLATDDFLAGVYRMPRGRALGKRYIEANPQAISNLLVVDVDHSDAAMRLLWDRVGWRPNVIVENPANGNAHGVWALEEAITRTDYARRAPIRYGARVTEGLRRSVDGDRGYAGLLTKNPVHPDWTAWPIHDHLYALGELDERLDDHRFMPPVKMLDQKRWRTDPTGLGRNEALFRALRYRFYRELRHHFGDPDGLAAAALAYAVALNATFTDPLPASEVRGIAASVTRWIVTKSRMWADGPVVYDATFSTIQAARGRKGGRKSGVSRAEASARRRSVAAEVLLL